MPLVQSMHTLGKVKNASLAVGERLEPEVRLRGEAEVIAAADRLIANTDDEARDLISGYDAAPGPGRGHQPGGQPLGVPARLTGGGPAASWACPPTGSCWCSPAGSSRSRRRTSCCTRRPGWSPTTRAWPGRLTDRVRGRPERGRPRRPGRADRAGRQAGAGRPDPARAAVPAAGAGQLVPGGDASSWCRRTPSRSGWSRWRPRPAARRWWRRRSAGCAPRSGTGCPGSWWTPVTRPGTRGPSAT